MCDGAFLITIRLIPLPQCVATADSEMTSVKICEASLSYPSSVYIEIV